MIISNMKNVILFFVTILFLSSCNEHKGYEYETGHFTESVVNFSDVNSEYDDYNSAAPFIYNRSLFHFSSNRKSLGKDFDIVGENMFIDWSKTLGTLKIGTNTYDDRFDYLIPMFDSINTSCNELGPFSLFFGKDISYSEVLWTDLIMYSNDCSGNYDIRFIYSELHNSSGSRTTEIKHSEKIIFLNSNANDLYPSFYGKDIYYYNEWGLDVSKIEKIIYCSDREGKFNIYEVNIPSDSTLINTLKSNQSFESIKLNINSEADDKCPFVNGNFLVFTSNRAGGFGGFDLYYSRYVNGNWSEPVNFGDKINTQYDEYRPITLHYPNFDNNLLIFSSNRPGGKGGFDLYYCGIEQTIK